jgi:uncharacterized protein (TIGR02271 family)
MTMRDFRSALREGMTVYSVDDEKLGKIVRCDAGSFLIEKGIFFPKDYIARYEDVVNVVEDDVRLSLTKDMLTRADDAALARDTDTAPIGEGPQAPYQKPIAGQEVRVPLAEERLEVDKRAVETGSVKIRKDVKVEEKQITVPVMHEEVHVERTAVSRPVQAGDATFREETVRVPIIEEEIEVRKRPVVREEVRVTKQPVVEQRTATDTVRREELDVDETDVRRTKRGDDPLKKY